MKCLKREWGSHYWLQALSPVFTLVNFDFDFFSQCKKYLPSLFTSSRFLLQVRIYPQLSVNKLSFSSNLHWKWLCNPSQETVANQYLCYYAVKAFISLVWMPSPHNSFPSPPVVCVQAFLLFVLQDIFTTAVVSKLPFIKAKQANTNMRKQPGSEPYLGSRRRSRDGCAEEPQLPWQGPRQPSLQLHCHPFYKPHGYTLLCVSHGMAIQSAYI